MNGVKPRENGFVSQKKLLRDEMEKLEEEEEDSCEGWWSMRLVRVLISQNCTQEIDNYQTSEKKRSMKTMKKVFFKVAENTKKG